MDVNKVWVCEKKLVNGGSKWNKGWRV
jgi:hypothetical protein